MKNSHNECHYLIVVQNFILTYVLYWNEQLYKRRILWAVLRLNNTLTNINYFCLLNKNYKSRITDGSTTSFDWVSNIWNIHTYTYIFKIIYVSQFFAFPLTDTHSFMVDRLTENLHWKMAGFLLRFLFTVKRKHLLEALNSVWWSYRLESENKRENKIDR